MALFVAGTLACPVNSRGRGHTSATPETSADERVVSECSAESMLRATPYFSARPYWRS